MRKNTLLTCMFALVLVVGLAMLAGCGGTGEGGSGKAGQVKADSTVVVIGEEQFKLSSSAEMGAMHYLENYVDFHTDQIGIIRTMSYGVGDTFHFEIRMITVEGQSLEEAKAAVETTSGTTEQTREINGVSYVYYEYVNDQGTPVHFYLHVHDGQVYTIVFFLGEDPGNIEDVFMGNVSFR